MKKSHAKLKKHVSPLVLRAVSRDSCLNVLTTALDLIASISHAKKKPAIVPGAVHGAVPAEGSGKVDMSAGDILFEVLALES